MDNKNTILAIVDIPENELNVFKDLIRSYRSQYIRTSSEIIETVFDREVEYLGYIEEGKVSSSISELREKAWQEYLLDEVDFNALIMRDLHKLLDTPDDILNNLVNRELVDIKEDDLIAKVKDVCGEYAGRVFPYIYQLSLSNTQSRRSRAGQTFEAIIYKIYEILEYEYDSQSKVGRNTFESLGLGKKVDSILPNVERFKQRRNKTIIGTMKTSLRERWQEVAEEIERTKIPEIHLLTADEDISLTKAKEMSNHNITVVAYDWVANSEALKSMKNVISFEKYLFEEIPSVIKFWDEN